MTSMGLTPIADGWAAHSCHFPLSTSYSYTTLILGSHQLGRSHSFPAGDAGWRQVGGDAGASVHPTSRISNSFGHVSKFGFMQGEQVDMRKFVGISVSNKIWMWCAVWNRSVA